MNTTQGLNLMDTIQGDQYSQQPSVWDRHRLMNAAQQLPQEDNSGLIGTGGSSQGQALAMMNTPGSNFTLNHGLIGGIVHQYLGEFLGDKTKGMLSGDKTGTSANPTTGIQIKTPQQNTVQNSMSKYYNNNKKSWQQTNQEDNSDNQ